MGNQTNAGYFTGQRDKTTYLSFPLSKEDVVKINALRYDIQKWIKADMQLFAPLKEATAVVVGAQHEVTQRGMIALNLIEEQYVPPEGFIMTLNDITFTPSGAVVFGAVLTDPAMMIAELHAWIKDLTVVDPAACILPFYTNIEVFTPEEVSALYEVSTEAMYGLEKNDFIVESLVTHMRQLLIDPKYGLLTHSHVRMTGIEVLIK